MNPWDSYPLSFMITRKEKKNMKLDKPVAIPQSIQKQNWMYLCRENEDGKIRIKTTNYIKMKELLRRYRTVPHK